MRRAFDAALEQVRVEQLEAQSVDAQLAQLANQAPDLADLVSEERLPLAEAYAAL
jgi:hypothetical protein